MCLRSRTFFSARLVEAALEGESPKDFIKRHAPSPLVQALKRSGFKPHWNTWKKRLGNEYWDWVPEKACYVAFENSEYVVKITERMRPTKVSVFKTEADTLSYLQSIDLILHQKPL